MTKKKIRSVIAKIFRQNIHCNFIESIKIAKIFLNYKEWEYTNENYDLGFEYEYETDYNYTESLMFQGKIRNFEIPLQLYNFRECYHLKKLYR